MAKAYMAFGQVSSKHYATSLTGNLFSWLYIVYQKYFTYDQTKI